MVYNVKQEKTRALSFLFCYMERVISRKRNKRMIYVIGEGEEYYENLRTLCELICQEFDGIVVEHDIYTKYKDNFLNTKILNFLDTHNRKLFKYLYNCNNYVNTEINCNRHNEIIDQYYFTMNIKENKPIIVDCSV